MEEFIHRQNLLLLRKQLSETPPPQTRRLQLLKLLAEEEAKNCAPLKEK